jgi:HAD superfamily hydrolase (TIGR01509 family)
MRRDAFAALTVVRTAATIAAEVTMERFNELTALGSIGRGILFDWDGLIVDSQPAKNSSWVLSALFHRNIVPAEMVNALRKAQRAADPAKARLVAQEAVTLLREQHVAALQTVSAFEGLSRRETLEQAWRTLMQGYAGPATKQDVETVRNDIKDALISYTSTPIAGTVEFIRAAAGLQLPIGLVTQAKLEDVESLAGELGVPIDLFGARECTGDEFYAQMKDVNQKAVAFAVACAKLNIDPATSVACDDADAGIEAAVAVGLHCIGLKRRDSRQSFAKASLVLNDLGALATPAALQAFMNLTTAELFPRLRAIVPLNNATAYNVADDPGY